MQNPMYSEINKSLWNRKTVLLLETQQTLVYHPKRKGTITFLYQAAMRERSPIKPVRYLVETLYADGLYQEGMNALKECNPQTKLKMATV